MVFDMAMIYPEAKSLDEMYKWTRTRGLQVLRLKNALCWAPLCWAKDILMPIIPKRAGWDNRENILAIIPKIRFYCNSVTASDPGGGLWPKMLWGILFRCLHRVCWPGRLYQPFLYPLTFGNRKVNLQTWLLPIMSASCWHSVKIDENWHQITRYLTIDQLY